MKTFWLIVNINWMVCIMHGGVVRGGGAMGYSYFEDLFFYDGDIELVKPL